MYLKLIKTFLVVFTLGNLSSLFSQGCSDAGVCTFNPSSFSTEPIKEKNKIVLLAGSNGVGEQNINSSQIIMAYEHVFDKFKLNIKSIYQLQNGEVSIRGFGDLFILGSYAINNQLNLNSALKIPFNGGDLEYDGVGLPMAYQTSLGTFDILAGVCYNIKGLSVTLATQIPVTQNNNTFLSSHSDTTEKWATLPSSNNFKRKADILFDSKYGFDNLMNDLVLAPGFNLIYHIGNDSYDDAIGNTVEHTGSQGATINLTLNASYKISESLQVTFLLGTPQVTRDIRPEGLTRRYVISLGLKQSF